jgi:hypothetical protein
MIKMAVLSPLRAERGNTWPRCASWRRIGCRRLPFSQPAGYTIPAGGYADNVATVFLDALFHQPGLYVVQTLD